MPSLYDGTASGCGKGWSITVRSPDVVLFIMKVQLVGVAKGGAWQCVVQIHRYIWTMLHPYIMKVQLVGVARGGAWQCVVQIYLDHAPPLYYEGTASGCGKGLSMTQCRSCVRCYSGVELVYPS